MEPDITYTIEEVHAFMCEAHKGQFRMNNVTPYSTNPEWVKERAIELFAQSDPEIVLTARFQALCLLHDVAEDCTHKGPQYTFDGIRERFKDPILVDWIIPVTKPPKPAEYAQLRGKAKEKAKLEFNLKSYTKLFREGHRASHLCKFADRDVNLSDLNGCSEYFRRFQIADTKNLIEAAESIPGVEVIKARLKQITG